MIIDSAAARSVINSGIDRRLRLAADKVRQSEGRHRRRGALLDIHLVDAIPARFFTSHAGEGGLVIAWGALAPAWNFRPFRGGICTVS